VRAKTFGQSALLLMDVIDVLLKRHIPYAVVGAMAASYYGIPRASMDADAVISLKRKRAMIDELKESFSLAKLKVIVKMGDDEDPLIGLILIEDEFGNQVDLILGIKGMQESVFKRIRKASFQNAEINMIGLEDFIAMKIFAGSPKDINDVKGALELSGEDIDFKLLRKLTLAYGEKEVSKLEGLI